MLSKNKFCLQAVVAMQLCVCVCVVVFREGWVLWCLICCEASISRTQQSPGWPSGPAVSDTSSPSCPAASPDGGGPTRRRAHRSSSPPPTTHSGQRGGENGGLSYLCHPHLHLHLHLQPLLLLLLHLWPCSRDEDSPTSLPSLIFCVAGDRQTDF